MLAKTIEELIAYAKANLSLNEADVIFIRNNLLREFSLPEGYVGEIDLNAIASYETPTPLIQELQNDVPDIKEEEIERVMSLISPTPSEVEHQFFMLKAKDSEVACKYLYNLMIKNNYIKLDEIRKNFFWQYIGDENTLDITINLAKPEKNNKDIAKLVGSVSYDYPKCALCYENVGFFGGNGKPARSNIRVVPVKLEGEDWFMQYSPYSYYDEHAIIINKKHVPMLINKGTFYKLMDFVDEYPSYFVGSNSDLPIVGGSILNHEHFQGGLAEMPMMRSRVRYNLSRKGLEGVNLYYLDWYNSTILIVSNDKEKAAQICELILLTWENYNDQTVDIISSDETGRHSTVTPIVRKVGDKYYIYIILRNNRTSNEYPDGIFHAHKEYHNIKKEGIGLIEAMGLFILPGRLVNELSLITHLLCNHEYTIRETVENNPSLEKHLDFINNLIIKYRRNNTEDQAYEIVRSEVGKTCENILRNTGVFKDTIDGQMALFRFFRLLSFEVIKDE